MALTVTSITALAPICYVNGACQPSAIATFSDGTTSDVSAACTWSSADNTIAYVTVSVGFDNGTANGVKAGSVTLTATYQGISATCTLQVIGGGSSYYPGDQLIQQLDHGDDGHTTVSLWDSTNQVSVALPEFSIVGSKWYSWIPYQSTTKSYTVVVQQNGYNFPTPNPPLPFPDDWKVIYPPPYITVSTPPGPAIQALSPNHGRPGDALNIQGRHLFQASSVTMGGLSVSFSQNNTNHLGDQKVSCSVPFGISIGRQVVVITTPQGTASTNYYIDNPATLSTITVNPDSVTVGSRVQMKAIGNYGDGSTTDISYLVTWSSTTPSLATIGSTGAAFGVGPGLANIKAIQGAITGQGTLTVSAVAFVGPAGSGGGTPLTGSPPIPGYTISPVLDRLPYFDRTGGRDVSLLRIAASGKYDVQWDNTQNVVFADDMSHAVLSLVLEHRGEWWADSSGQRGSFLWTVRDDRKATPSQVKAFIDDSLQPLVSQGLIVNPSVTVKRLRPGTYDLNISYGTPGGKTVTLRPSVRY